MENLLIINKISIVAVWAIFWAYLLTVRITRKNEFQSAFSGVKKMPSATASMFGFFSILSFVLYQDNLSMLNSVSDGWQFTWQVFGYVMLLSGFAMAIWVAWSLQNPLPAAAPKFSLFKYLRNMMYGAVMLIAVGSSTMFLNPLAAAMVVALIPLLVYRISIEDAANANI